MQNFTAKDKSDVSDINPFTRIAGIVADILDMCVHKFYDMVRFREQMVDFPLPQSKLGRFLGLSRNNGKKMAMHILALNRLIVPCRTVIPLTTADLNMRNEKS